MRRSRREFASPIPTLTVVGALAAFTLPMLIAYQRPPSPSSFAQCTSFVGTGMFIAALRIRAGELHRTLMPLTALGIIILAILGSMLVGSLPQSLGLQALGAVLVAGVVLVASAQVTAHAGRDVVWAAFCIALLLAALGNALIGTVQVFLPWVPADKLVAAPTLIGRAVGNLRQPNLLALLLLWGLVASVWLHGTQRLSNWALGLLVLLFSAVIELTASRIGLIGLVGLAVWGAVDRTLSRPARLALLAAPLAYFAMMGIGEQFGYAVSSRGVGAGARLAQEGIDSEGSRNHRLNVWRTAFALANAHPWAGVGFGQFNLAWTMTAFESRPTGLFDHAHNLFLQFAVELGWPLASLITLLLAISLWRGMRSARRADAPHHSSATAALMIVAVAAMHSFVEFPLWYAYFLFPTAFALGWSLGTAEVPERQQQPSSRRQNLIGWAVGATITSGGLWALLEQHEIAQIYQTPPGNQTLLEERLKRGQRSLLFAHHADYLAAIASIDGERRRLGIHRAIHSLIDGRLLAAWARQLNADGHVDLARTAAQRIRDLRRRDDGGLLRACHSTNAADAGVPNNETFACETARHTHDWQEFVVASGAERLPVQGSR